MALFVSGASLYINNVRLSTEPDRYSIGRLHVRAKESMKRRVPFVIASIASLFFAPTAAQGPGDRPAPNPRATRSVVLARDGLIATSQPLASAAGLQVLQEGGNAIDAAV